MIALLVPLSILACISDLVAGSVAWYRGVKPARFYVFAWACLLLGTIIMAFQKAGLLPNNAWTEYSVQFGSALEAVLLSFAMADRIQTERRLRLSAQEETIQTARRLNEELEKRVDERTSELATLNKRLEELSNTDQLTDLHNRRYLVEAGHREWHRCARGKHPISVLILDVDYFKQVNDNYGHSTGDLCLQRIAGSLRGVLRSSVDVVARYGGEEFCVVLPETDKQGALCVAERLRKDIEDTIIKHGDLMLQVTVSIGLHTVRPDKGGTFEEALHVADKGLYQAKENGRNQVGTVGATLKVQQ
jgi:diguanylate cyclase (GGDEF)-like protein